MTVASLLPPSQRQRRGEGASTPTPATDTEIPLVVADHCWGSSAPNHTVGEIIFGL